MVKHIQNNSSAWAEELFECVDHFVGLALKGLTGGYDKIETESLYYFFGSTNQKGQGYKSGQYVSYLVNEGW